MTRTARRRWTRELENTLVDGIALGSSGPVLLHGYEDPVGGKWIDSVIPGKLAALDRSSGSVLWSSPCEVGYGRGFGAGLGPDNDAVVLGPSAAGHRMVRMALDSGEVLGVANVEPFDEALVFPDLCVSVTPTRVAGIHTATMIEVWDFQMEGRRFHQFTRDGGRLFVVFTDGRTTLQGIMVLDIETGELLGNLLEPKQKVVYGMASQPGVVVALVTEILAALPEEQWPSFEDAPGGGGMNLLGLSSNSSPGDRALWFEPVPVEPGDDFPDVHIRMDSGKLYLLREALVEVRDALTGRQLGELTVPGLDERIDWGICDGAGLLAEEERVSIFEIPV